MTVIMEYNFGKNPIPDQSKKNLPACTWRDRG